MKEIKLGVLYSFLGEFLSKIPLYIAELVLVSNLSMRSYGLWTSLQVVLRSLVYVHMGMLSAYNKISPLYFGGKRKDELRKLNITVFTYMQLVGIILLVLSLIMVLITYERDRLWGLNWKHYLLLGFIGLLTQSYIFYQASLKNETNYKRLSIGIVLYATVYMMLCYLLAEDLQLTGVLISLAVSYFIAVLYYKMHNMNTFDFDFDFSFMYKTLASGLAPFLFTISHFLFQMSDRLVLMIATNMKIMAQYGFAYTACQLLLLMVNAIDRVFSTYLLRSIGKGDRTLASMYSVNSMWIVSLAGALAISGFLIFGEYLIGLFFSQYSNIYLSIIYMMIGIYFFSTVQPIFSYIIGLNGEKKLINFHMAMILITVLSIWIGVQFKESIEVAAQIYCAIQLFYFLVVLFIFLNFMVKDVVITTRMKLLLWFKFLSALILPICSVIGIFLYLKGIFNVFSDQTLYPMVIDYSILLVVLFPLLYINWMLYKKLIQKLEIMNL